MAEPLLREDRVLSQGCSHHPPKSSAEDTACTIKIDRALVRALANTHNYCRQTAEWQQAAGFSANMITAALSAGTNRFQDGGHDKLVIWQSLAADGKTSCIKQ